MIYKTALAEEVDYFLAKRMRSERVAFDKKDSASYIGAWDGDTLIGVVGFQIIGNTMRYKADYVLPDYRGRGVYGNLFRARSEVTGYFDGQYSAFCTEHSLPVYLKNGFVAGRVNKNGITFVSK